MTKYFCTLFDRNYLIKGLAMMESLKRHCSDAHLHVLCMDDLTKEILTKLNLSYVTCLALHEVEDEELLAVKQSRSIAEYCWTLSPCLPWYIFQKNKSVDSIVYLDADLFFFSELQPLFDEESGSSITIIEHRFPPALRKLEVNGRFCVEWIGFRRDPQGMKCLEYWRQQCIEWCFHRLEPDRMGDQKYLDKWPEKYDRLHILQHLGAGLAPWNYGGYSFKCNQNGEITVNGFPLIFYHFHQFQLLSNGKFDRLSNAYKILGPEPKKVYEIYEHAIAKTLLQVRRLDPQFAYGIRPYMKVKSQRIAQMFLSDGLKAWMKKFIKAV
jgi:Glycosyl transferase family 8